MSFPAWRSRQRRNEDSAGEAAGSFLAADVRRLAIGMMVVGGLFGAPSVHGQADAGANPASAPTPAEEAMPKANLRNMVASEYFNGTRAVRPEERDREPLYQLGLEDAAVPGRELSAIAWFRTYAVLNGVAVRTEEYIHTLDQTAEGRINGMMASLRELAAQFPAGSGQSSDAAEALAALTARWTGGPSFPKAPRDTNRTPAERGKAWVSFIDLRLDPPVPFETVSEIRKRVDEIFTTESAVEKTWVVFSDVAEQADIWIRRLKDLRAMRPETEMPFDERTPEREEAVVNARAGQMRQEAAARLARVQKELPEVTAFLGRLAANEALMLVPIPAGEFTMGDSNHTAPHRVTISRPFFLGATEVTQAQWTAVMGRNPSRFKGPARPAERVSWLDAMAFCKKLNEREQAAGRLPAGWRFTLPTEAQWEYAARAGTTGNYLSNAESIAWYGENSGEITHAVGLKPANAWGLFDMLGNVAEWCLDALDSYPKGSVTDPTGPGDDRGPRVIRGGGWNYSPEWVRFAAREGNGDTADFDTFGFRIALSAFPEGAPKEREATKALPAQTPPVAAVPAASFDGDWRGAVKTPDGTELRIRIVIKANEATQYFHDGSGWNEAGSTKDRATLSRLNDICVVSWLNRGGIWTEHQMFSLSRVNASKLKVVWLRHVTNHEAGQDGAPWSQQADGELVLTD